MNTTNMAKRGPLFISFLAILSVFLTAQKKGFKVIDLNGDLIFNKGVEDNVTTGKMLEKLRPAGPWVGSVTQRLFLLTAQELNSIDDQIQVRRKLEQQVHKNAARSPLPGDKTLVELGVRDGATLLYVESQ